MPAATFQRTPLVVTAGNLTAGPVHATFRASDPESLLHSYLVLVRQLRGQQREPTITLRGSDISALADHLGSTEERVLDDLLDRMGATRAQRKALLALFAVGALSIVATGSVALDLAPAGVFAQSADDRASVTETIDLPAQLVSVAPTASAVVPIVTEPAPVAELAIASGGAEWEYMVSLQLLTQALSTQPAADLDVTLPEGVGVADDGSTVAVASPPVPPVAGVGVADDGSTVAVAPPPVPPVAGEGVGVADDGSTVAVAPPPVPPTAP